MVKDEDTGHDTHAKDVGCDANDACIQVLVDLICDAHAMWNSLAVSHSQLAKSWDDDT